MADEPTELRRINWEECFSFTHIFKTFRMAIHPTKLGLALAGLVLMGLWGTVLDGIWRCTDCRPLEGEVNAFWQVGDIDAWRKATRQEQAEQLADAYEGMGQAVPENLASVFADDPAEATDEALRVLGRSYEDAAKKIEQDGEARNLKDEAVRREKAAAALGYNELHARLSSLGPKGVFTGLLPFEMAVVRQMIDAARGLNFTGATGEVMSARARSGESAFVPSVKTGPDGLGVLSCVVLMLRGAQWLVVEHWLFAILFGLGSLAIWSLFGGALCRVAALNVARDERIPPKTALSFAARKFFGFFTAPLLPIALIVVVGVCLFVGGMFTAIPYVGDLLGGVGMGLALLGGFVMALVAVGALAGVWLMWPTIAVEGSDGFDAMSRSYCYVYARPWRAGFYAAVALVYGALCYLFARFFVLVLLKLTRLFVGLGIRIFPTYRPGTGLDGAKKIDAIWPHSSFEMLVPDAPPFGAETWGDAAAAWLIGLWVLILAGLLCAFLVSFFLNASTIIYCLLRLKVDATDIEDVYLEEDEEEEEETLPAPAATESDAPSLSGDEPARGRADSQGSQRSREDSSAKSEEPPASDTPDDAPGGE